MPPRVYIAHADPERQRVRALVQQLRAEGIDAHVERDQLATSTIILVVCSPALARLLEHDPDLLAAAPDVKRVALLFEDAAVEHIPTTLRKSPYHRLPDEYDDLYRRLTDQPAPLGQVRVLSQPTGGQHIDNRGATIGTMLNATGNVTIGALGQPSVVAPPTRDASPTPPDTIAILFASANPNGTDPLRLAREERGIREAIALAPHAARLQLDTLPAATFADLRRALLRKRYEIVHVSGHGEHEGLLFEDESGNCAQLPPDVLAATFANFAPPHGALRCVVLNACYSRSSGARVSMRVPYTIGMDGPVSDRAAIEFSRGFYDAIGAGLPVPRAYREGLICVEAAVPGARFDASLLE